MEKLYRLFHIEKLLLCGGGGADWSFLDAGMVDELSLVIAPVTDGSQGSASVFAGIPGLNGVSPLEFSLKEVRQTEGGGVYLRCLAKKTQSETYFPSCHASLMLLAWCSPVIQSTSSVIQSMISSWRVSQAMVFSRASGVSSISIVVSISS